MTSLSKTMASFSRAEGILAVLFGLGFVLGFLNCPGFDGGSVLWEDGAHVSTEAANA